MHEFSVARALLGLVREHLPEARTLRSVHIRVGPAQAIEPVLLETAWQSITEDDSFAGSVLELVVDPWRLRCTRCDREFDAQDWNCPCDCGAPSVVAAAGQEIILESMDVDDVHEARAAKVSQSGVRT